MAKTDFRSADEYIATFPAPVQAILQEVRQTIIGAAPDAEELISYQIPAIKAQGSWVFYYSAYAKHYSLSCPPPFTVFEAFADELARYTTSKSTIQFPLDEPVPTDLIARMVRFRVQENQEKAAKKKAKK